MTSDKSLHALANALAKTAPKVAEVMYCDWAWPFPPSHLSVETEHVCIRVYTHDGPHRCICGAECGHVGADDDRV